MVAGFGEVLEKGPAYFYHALNPVIEDYLIGEELGNGNTETGSFVEPVNSSEYGDEDGKYIHTLPICKCDMLLGTCNECGIK